MTKPKPKKIKKPEPFDFYELDVIATFLLWNSQDFIDLCQAFDRYTKKQIVKIIEKVNDHCFYNV